MLFTQLLQRRALLGVPAQDWLGDTPAQRAVLTKQKLVGALFVEADFFAMMEVKTEKTSRDEHGCAPCRICYTKTRPPGVKVILLAMTRWIVARPRPFAS